MTTYTINVIVDDADVEPASVFHTRETSFPAARGMAYYLMRQHPAADRTIITWTARNGQNKTHVVQRSDVPIPKYQNF